MFITFLKKIKKIFTFPALFFVTRFDTMKKAWMANGNALPQKPFSRGFALIYDIDACVSWNFSVISKVRVN